MSSSSRSGNKRLLLRWSDDLRAREARAAVRAGRTVLADALRRRVPDRKGRLPRLAGVGPAVLETPVRTGAAGAFASVYVGVRFTRVVDEILAAEGPAVTDAMSAVLEGQG